MYDILVKFWDKNMEVCRDENIEIKFSKFSFF